MFGPQRRYAESVGGELALLLAPFGRRLVAISWGGGGVGGVATPIFSVPRVPCKHLAVLCSGSVRILPSRVVSRTIGLRHSPDRCLALRPACGCMLALRDLGIGHDNRDAEGAPCRLHIDSGRRPTQPHARYCVHPWVDIRPRPSGFLSGFVRAPCRAYASRPQSVPSATPACNRVLGEFFRKRAEPIAQNWSEVLLLRV